MSELEPLHADEIAVLEADDGGVTEKLLSEADELRAILKLARRETARRLRSRKLREQIPSGTLLRFTLDATKLLTKVDESHPRDEREEAQATHVLAVIADHGIPVERQAELLEQFIGEVGPDRAKELGLTAALDILVGKREAANRLAIELEADDGET